MFGFVVTIREDFDSSGRVGSVVSPPQVLGLDLVVTVMWDDDLTFSVHGVGELQAVRPDPKEPEEKPFEEGEKIVNMFSNKKAATKH